MLNYMFAIGVVLFCSPAALAEADICSVRPDLCDSRPAARAPVARKETRSKRLVAKSRAKTKNCRPRGASFSLATAELPECGSEAAVDADDALYENTRNPMRDEIVQPARAKNGSPINAIDIDSYLMANANHPAFANRKGSRQVAFEKNEKAAVIIMPSLDGGTGVREGQ